ncbi:MAG: germination protein YpeB [Oscillospiraceae bacterium]
MKRRTVVKLSSFAIAAVAALAGRNIQLMHENKINSRAVEYSYMRAAEELSTAADNINNTLEKQLCAGTPDYQLQLSEKLRQDSATAKSALEQLPIKELQLENTYKFLSQVGNYALSLSQKAANGEKISDDEYETLKSLHEYSQQLSGDLWGLENSLNSGEISLSTAASAMARSDDSTPTITDSFKEVEKGFDKYPTLIYDGPFSDRILNQTPKMTAGQKEVSKKDALTKAVMVTGLNSNEFVNVTEEAGSLPSYVFSDKDGSVTCSVTKQGGFLSYLLKSRQVDKENISIKDALAKSEQFLSDIGINSLKMTYYENYDGILTINYAYSDNGICVYTDLVKVSIALDNGEILGYDAMGYITNHHDRTYSEDQISEAAAQKQVSPMLTVSSHQMAVIPSDGGGEIFCHEFKCKNDNGKNVLVYINAENAKEERILILFESENGTLTM